MAYADVTVVVDGAEESCETFHDETLLREHIDQVREDARGDGYPTEVYVLYHEHSDLPDDGECACVQYVTDHKPAYAWNVDGPGTGFDD